MKRIFIILIILIAVGCKEEPACCDHIAEFPRIKVLNSNNVDLLDPENIDHFDHSDISISTLIESNLQNLSLEIRRVLLSTSDSGDFIINVNENMVGLLSSDGIKEFYLKLGTEDTDTISLLIENSTTRKLELNGENWADYDSLDFTYVIRK
ncbi:MAG: hypothetical protein RJQ14_18610 [Marinoscillum sp.]